MLETPDTNMYLHTGFNYSYREPVPTSVHAKLLKVIFSKPLRLNVSKPLKLLVDLLFIHFVLIINYYVCVCVITMSCVYCMRVCIHVGHIIFLLSE